MTRLTEHDEQEVHEGTEALQKIADDVEEQRAKAKGKTNLPSNAGEDEAGPDLEDSAENENSDAVPVHPPAKPHM